MRLYYFPLELEQLDDKPPRRIARDAVAVALRCAGPSAPPPPNYYQQTNDTLQAQIAEAPNLYQEEAQYQPQYANLSLENLNTLLNGGNGQPGIIQQQTQNLMPAEQAASSAATSAQRAADIRDVQTLGPQAQAAMAAANPQAAALLATMTTQAQAGLNAGTGLTADQQRQLNNSVAGAQGARGMAYGPAASYAQVLANTQAGQQLQQQRTATATNVLGAQQQFYGDPFAQILGRPSTASANSSALLQQGQGMQPGRQFNPDDPNAMAQWSQYNSEMAQYNAANSPMAYFGDVTTGIGNLVGAGSKAAMM